MQHSSLICWIVSLPRHHHSTARGGSGISYTCKSNNHRSREESQEGEELHGNNSKESNCKLTVVTASLVRFEIKCK